MNADASRQQLSPRKAFLKVYTRFEECNLIASVVVAAEAHLAQGATVELRLLQSGEEVLQRRTIRRLLPGTRREVVFPLDEIKSGCCVIRATLTDRHGRTLEAHVLQEKAPPPTDWLGSAEGITRKVPAPWTPLKTRRRSAHSAVGSVRQSRHHNLCWQNAEESVARRGANLRLMDGGAPCGRGGP